jgi:hypothetical protein
MCRLRLHQVCFQRARARQEKYRPVPPARQVSRSQLAHAIRPDEGGVMAMCLVARHVTSLNCEVRSGRAPHFCAPSCHSAFGPAVAGPAPMPHSSAGRPKPHRPGREAPVAVGALDGLPQWRLKGRRQRLGGAVYLAAGFAAMPCRSTSLTTAPSTLLKTLPPSWGAERVAGKQ